MPSDRRTQQEKQHAKIQDRMDAPAARQRDAQTSPRPAPPAGTPRR